MATISRYSFAKIKLCLEKPPEQRTEEEITELLSLIKKNKFFAPFDDNVLLQVCKVLEHEFSPAGTSVFKKGDVPDKFYVIMSQSYVDVMIGDENGREISAAKLGYGEGFGEMGLINDSKRGATVYCYEDCHFMVLSKINYNKVLRRYHLKILESEATWLQKIIASCNKPLDMRSDMDIDNLHVMLKGIDFFKEMPEKVRIELCQKIGYSHYKEGDIVFQKGGLGDMFYVVVFGVVDIVMPPNREQPEKIVKSLRAGESFGELAILNDAFRAATARCGTDVHLLTLNKRDYNEVLGDTQAKEMNEKGKWVASVFPVLTWENGISRFKNRRNHLQMLLSMLIHKATYQKGDEITTIGEKITNLRFIVSGKIASYVEAPLQLVEPDLAGLSAAELAAARTSSQRRSLTRMIHVLDFGPGDCIGAHELFAATNRIQHSNRKKAIELQHAFRFVVQSETALVAEITLENWNRQVPQIVKVEQYGHAVIRGEKIRDGVVRHLAEFASSGWHLTSALKVPVLVPCRPEDSAEGTLGIPLRSFGDNKKSPQLSPRLNAAAPNLRPATYYSDLLKGASPVRCVKQQQSFTVPSPPTATVKRKFIHTHRHSTGTIKDDLQKIAITPPSNQQFQKKAWGFSSPRHAESPTQSSCFEVVGNSPTMSPRPRHFGSTAATAHWGNRSYRTMIVAASANNSIQVVPNNDEEHCLFVAAPPPPPTRPSTAPVSRIATANRRRPVSATTPRYDEKPASHLHLILSNAESKDEDHLNKFKLDSNWRSVEGSRWVKRLEPDLKPTMIIISRTAKNKKGQEQRQPSPLTDDISPFKREDSFETLFDISKTLSISNHCLDSN